MVPEKKNDIFHSCQYFMTRQKKRCSFKIFSNKKFFHLPEIQLTTKTTQNVYDKIGI